MWWEKERKKKYPQNQLNWVVIVMCECALHIKPLFLPVDIRHNQPAVLVPLERYMLYVVTKLRHRDSALLCSKQSRQCNAMPSYWIRRERHTHSMEEKKQNKQSKQKIIPVKNNEKRKNKGRKKQSERTKKQTKKKGKKCRAPPYDRRCMW